METGFCVELALFLQKTKEILLYNEESPLYKRFSPVPDAFPSAADPVILFHSVRTQVSGWVFEISPRAKDFQFKAGSDLCPSPTQTLEAVLESLT